MTYHTLRGIVANRTKSNKTTSGLFIWLVVALAGCSNTAVIKEKDIWIQQQRKDLASCKSLVATLQDNLKSQTTQHQLESQKAEQELTQCQQSLDEQVALDRQLLEREEELRERLASDIDQKNIEIENLKGRLSVKVLDKILFQSGSVVILPDGRDVLTRVAASLADSSEKLRIEGHTDDVLIGPELVQRIPSNWELSVLRAASVVRFLESNNIESARLSAAGHSMFKPVVPNTDELNRQLNRRVVIVVLPDTEG